MSDEKTIEAKFLEFHETNPHVYNALVDLARDLKQAGHTKIGIGMLFEVLRWKSFMTTTDPNSNFKLSNSYRSRYARMIMDNESDLKGIFDIKKLRSA